MTRTLILAALAACQGVRSGGESSSDPARPSMTAPATPGSTDPDTDTDTDCLTDAEQFAAAVSPLLQSDCIVCHVEGGVAGTTRHVLVPGADPHALDANRAMLTPLALETTDEGQSLLLAKATAATDHGGGARIELASADYGALLAFVGRAEEPGGCVDPSASDDAEVPGSPLRRLTPSQYANAASDLFNGISLPPLGLQADPLVHGFDNNAATQAATALQVSQLHAASLTVTDAAMAQPEGWLTCDLDQPDSTCVHPLLDAFAARAARRPLPDDERAPYRALYDEVLAAEGDARAALQVALQAVLMSPDFLFLVEFGADQLAAPGERVPLTDHEIAARLSFFLWDSLPDAALTAAADAGGLADPAAIEAQAWRMLADPRAERAVGNFHRLWLELDEIASVAPYPEAFPDWDPATVHSARAEIDALVWASAFGEDPTLSHLLLSPVATVDAPLAAIYGVPPGESVLLPASQRAGVLTRVGWLGATSHEVYASPVQRGVFVLKQLLCTPPGPPPGDVDTSLAPDGGDIITNRDRYAIHALDPVCASCHVSIDGIGFGFEHYDAIGRWRDLDNGAPVDATGAFADGDLTGVLYDGALEMSERLASSRTVHDCSVTQWYRYALGRSETLGDAPTLAALRDAYWGTGGELPQLLVDLVRTESFRTRRAE